MRDLRFRPVLGGILSWIPGVYQWWDGRRPTGQTVSPSYAKGVWEIHRDNYRRLNEGALPDRVAELGPGATLGSCISALCDGVKLAIAFDAVPYAAGSEENIAVLNAVKSPDMDERAYRAIVASIRSLEDPTIGDSRLHYVAPWAEASVDQSSQVDLVFSHSVMEHVEDPAEAYAACFDWLRPGGLMSHKIDHSSHGLTRTWNGHYALSKWMWSIVKGNRPYLLNRLTPSRHRALILSAGFEILTEDQVRQGDDEASAFRPPESVDEDHAIKTTTFICRKPEAAREA